jgi:hypothetical protein
MSQELPFWENHIENHQEKLMFLKSEGPLLEKTRLWASINMASWKKKKKIKDTKKIFSTISERIDLKVCRELHINMLFKSNSPARD